MQSINNYISLIGDEYRLKYIHHQTTITHRSINYWRIIRFSIYVYFSQNPPPFKKIELFTERGGKLRIKRNDDLNKLTGNKTIINYIKSQRLGWLGHVHRMPDERMVKKGI